MRRLVQLLVLVTPLILALSAQAQQQPAGGRTGRGGAPAEPPRKLHILPKVINLEVFTRSAPTCAGMAAACTRKNGRANAIWSLEKVLEIDPQNQNAKRQLDQLKAQP